MEDGVNVASDAGPQQLDALLILAEFGNLLLQATLNDGRQFAQPFLESGSDLADTAVDIDICAARHSTTVDLADPLVGQMSAWTCLRPTNGARYLSGTDHADSSPGS